MELKLRRIRRELWLPIFSATALSIAVVLYSVNVLTIPKSESILIASHDLFAGELITKSDIRVVNLPLGTLANNYLRAFQGGLVLEHQVRAGEFLPKDFLTDQVDPRIPIRLNNLQPISSSIRVGDKVDIWATKTVQGIQQEPQPVALSALVASIQTNSALAQTTSTLEIRISPSYLETLLQATDSNYKISVVLHETVADMP